MMVSGRKARPERVYSSWFHLYKFQKQAKLIYGDKRQNNDYQRSHNQAGFWAVGNVLFVIWVVANQMYSFYKSHQAVPQIHCFSIE